MGKGLGVLTATAMAIAMLVGAAPAGASFGELFYEECHSGRDTHPNCVDTPTATLTGLGSGLSNAVDVAVSPDGDHVYAISGSDAAVSRFDRDPADGELTFDGCVTGDLSTTPNCTSTGANATASGDNSGLEDLVSVVISPDGESLYVLASGDDAITRFARDNTPGATYGDLTFDECITGDTNASPPCTDVTGATAGGGGSGMDNMAELAMADNGLYASADSDDAVVRLGRNPANGNIVEAAFQCDSGSTAVTNCAPTADATATGANSGLDDVSGIAVDPDNEANVYTTSFSDSAVAWFSRGMAGALTYQDCVSGETASVGASACLSNGAAAVNGIDSGLSQPAGVKVSPDGVSVYVAVGGDAGIAQLDRDTGDGDLSYQGCITGQTTIPPNCIAVPGAAGANGANSGLSGADALVIPPGGRSVHLAASDDSSLASFLRNSGTGDLTYLGCVSGETNVGSACTQTADAANDGVNSGLDQVAQGGTIASSPEGKSIYAAAQLDASVAEFDRENPPLTQISGPASPTNDNTPQFTFSTPSDPTTVSWACSVDGAGFGPCTDSTPSTGSHTTATLADGPHTFAVRATDSFGFTETPSATTTFTVDTAAPETVITGGPAESETVANPSPTFTYSSEAGANLQCRVDGGAFQACPGGSFTPPALTDGAHTFEVRAVDAASNVDQTPAARNFAVDSDAPETTIASGPKKKSKKKKAKFEFASDEAGSSFQCNLDDGGFEPCTASATFKVKRGKHTLQVRATDSAGNVDGSPAEQKWKVRKKK